MMLECFFEPLFFKVRTLVRINKNWEVVTIPIEYSEEIDAERGFTEFLVHTPCKSSAIFNKLYYESYFAMCSSKWFRRDGAACTYCDTGLGYSARQKAYKIARVMGHNWKDW